MGILLTKRGLRTTQPLQASVINHNDNRNLKIAFAVDLGRSIKDISGLGSDLADTSGINSSIAVSPGFGYAMKFTADGVDGTGSRLRVSQTNLDVTGPFTVIAAINASGAGDNTFGRIIDTGLNAAVGFALHMTGSTTLRLNSSGGGFVDSAASIVVGKWHLIVATFDGTNGCIWIDGIQGTPGAITTPVTIVGAGNFPTIGNSAGSTALDRDFSGYIGPVLLYKRKWADAEILSLGRNPAGIYSLMLPKLKYPINFSTTVMRNFNFFFFE